jgi:methionyl-tRNA formyltransferase
MTEHAKVAFPARPTIIFMGTPDFAVPSLKALTAHGHNVAAVITQPDRPRGRGRKLTPSPVKLEALEHDLEVLQPEKASDVEFCETIRSKNPDLLVVVAYGQILKKILLEIPRWGVLNIHASLLPRYRGAAPIQWAILNDDKVTGLTAMLMEEGLDSGPILLQESVPILPDETAGELHDRLSALSGSFLVKTLQGLTENRLEKKTAQKVSALIRALDPWPGASSVFKGKEIKLFSSRLIGEGQSDLVPGRVAATAADGIRVETGTGLVEIKELQVSGKKRLVAGDFIRGFPLEPGAVFGMRRTDRNK